MKTILTKENFFNELAILYPKAFACFSEWIDKYKEKVNWDKLFNVDSDYQNAVGKNAVAPKFHEIPYAIQLGILSQFATEIIYNDSVIGTVEHAQQYFINQFTVAMQRLELRIITNEENKEAKS